MTPLNSSATLVHSSNKPNMLMRKHLLKQMLVCKSCYSSSSTFRTSNRLPYCFLLHRLYPWLAPSWPSHQALTPDAGPSAGAKWRCDLFTLRASGQSPKHHPFIHVACLQLAYRPVSTPRDSTLQEHSIAPTCYCDDLLNMSCVNLIMIVCKSSILFNVGC